MELLVVSLKNVFRNRRRTILTVIALTVGIALMVTGMAWIQGYKTYIYDALIRFQTGQLHVLPESYIEESERYPVDIAIGAYDDTRELLRSQPAVAEAAGRINFSLRVSSGAKSTRLLGTAIDPEGEARITVIEDYIARGSYLTDRSGVLIGEPIARKMGISPEDNVYVRAMDSYGVENVTVLPVVGTFELGYPAMDESVLFMDLESAQELLSLGGRVTRIVIALNEGYQVAAAQREISALVQERLAGRVVVGGGNAGAAGQNGAAEARSAGSAQAAQSGLTVKPWRFFVQSIVNATRADMASFWGILVILYLMIVLGILNSMSMSVQERTAEIATLRAIGMRRGRILRLFLAESVWTAILGILAGAIVAAPLLYYLEVVGIPIGEAIPESLPVPFGTTFHSDFLAWHALVTAAVAVGTAVAGSLLPARRASRINIAQAMVGKK